MLGDLLLRVLGMSLNLEGVLKMLLVLRVKILFVYYGTLIIGSFGG